MNFFLYASLFCWVFLLFLLITTACFTCGDFKFQNFRFFNFKNIYNNKWLEEGEGHSMAEEQHRSVFRNSWGGGGDLGLILLCSWLTLQPQKGCWLTQGPCFFTMKWDNWTNNPSQVWQSMKLHKKYTLNPLETSMYCLFLYEFIQDLAKDPLSTLRACLPLHQGGNSTRGLLRGPQGQQGATSSNRPSNFIEKTITPEPRVLLATQ